MSNDYDKLAPDYQQTAEKPDKKYSILPTVLKLAGNLTGKTVVDYGCGDGYCTRELAALDAQKVIGLDNSTEQLELAQQKPAANIEYRLKDIFEGNLPKADVAIVPFVVNYAPTVQILKQFFADIHSSLKEGGRAVFVVDLPTGKDLRKFGAIKTILEDEDEAPIKIELFNENNLVCTLSAYYFKPTTIEVALSEAGFIKTTWHKPILAAEGLDKYGAEFWAGYTEGCELGYITTEK